jgi:hypothetical protein
MMDYSRKMGMARDFCGNALVMGLEKNAFRFGNSSIIQKIIASKHVDKTVFLIEKFEPENSSIGFNPLRVF